MKKFLEEMEKNQELKAKIEQLDKDPASTPKDYVRIAAEYGLEITEEDFKLADAQGELQDDELDAVAGGSDCICFGGGGGSASEGDNTCACVLGGGGETSSRNCRCACVIAGTGE